MLILNKDAMLHSITYPQVMDQVQAAYRSFAQGDFYMPDRPAFVYQGNTYLYMPCFTKKAIGTKFLTLYPDNPKQGLPYIDGVMILNDPNHGKPLAILDGSCLTAIRTGAVGGVGMRCFSRLDAHSVGVIGAGKQGFYQAVYAVYARGIQDVWFYDSYPKDWQSYFTDLSTVMGEKKPRFHVAASVEELIAACDIVVTATPATVPVVPDDPVLLRGKCFICIGSYKPQMREMPNAIWQLVDQVYTELPFAMEESGDLSQPLSDGLLTTDRVCYIGDLLNTEGKGPWVEPGQTTYFKSVGMSLLDLYVAQFIYEEAKRQFHGLTIEF